MKRIHADIKKSEDIIQKLNTFISKQNGKLIQYLKQDIEDEEKAIRDYKNQISYCRSLGDHKTADLLEHIAKEEEIHFKEISSRLQKI